MFGIPLSQINHGDNCLFVFACGEGSHKMKDTYPVRKTVGDRFRVVVLVGLEVADANKIKQVRKTRGAMKYTIRAVVEVGLRRKSMVMMSARTICLRLWIALATSVAPHLCATRPIGVGRDPVVNGAIM